MIFRSPYTFTFLPLEPSCCCPELPIDASLTLNLFALPPTLPTVSYIDNPTALLISQWFMEVTPLQFLHSLLSLPVFSRVCPDGILPSFIAFHLGSSPSAGN